MSWPTAIRMFSAAVALWSAVQVVHLATHLSMSPPTPTAELMSTHDKGVYVAFLVLHAVALVAFGVGALLPANVWRRINEKLEDRRTFAGWVYLHLALAILIVFLVSSGSPRYEVFLDLSAENLVKRDTHLLPPGVRQETISLGMIDVITGEFTRSGDHFVYVLSVGIRDGRRIVLAEDFPRQLTDAEPPSEASSLALAIAEKSGAEVDLK